MQPCAKVCQKHLIIAKQMKDYAKDSTSIKKYAKACRSLWKYSEVCNKNAKKNAQIC